MLPATGNLPDRQAVRRRAPGGARRRWLFRIAAIWLGLSVIVGAELTCRLFGWGRPTDYDDPFVGFSRIHPLFVLDDEDGVYRIPMSRLGFFAPESFPAEKQPGTFRVFCLGGSTVQGRPYSKESSFTTWLELSLEAAEPQRNWEVVNCGGISYASYRLVPILQECLNYQPDLFIICTGHNEFLEERSYEHIKHAPPVVARPLRTVARLRIFNLMRSAARGLAGGETPAETVQRRRPVLMERPDALLDYKNGIRAYHRDDEWRAGVIEHYEFNLRRMVAIAEDAGVPVILVRPPSNLADCPPFKSEHKADLSSEELARWEALIDEAHARYRTDLGESIRLLRRAIRIDALYAATYFELGKCYETLRLYEQAREAFWKARELDVCPLRMLAPMEEALARVARETGTPLIDAHELLEKKSRDGILGGYLLVDHIHPSPTLGHPMIADALAAEMVRQEWVSPEEDWEARRKRAYRRHAGSLQDLHGGMYFERGHRTLEAVRGWTQGRADGPPIESRKKHGAVTPDNRQSPVGSGQ